MSERILIVDDEEHLRALVTHFLEEDDYELTEAAGSEEVLTLIEKQEFDLILLDVSMPRLSGFQLAAIIREKPALHRVPIIFLTAHKELEDKLLAFNLGAADYMLKPFNGDELRARISALLKDRREGNLEKEQARVETISQLMITLAHHINNALMTMMGRALITDSSDAQKVEELKETVQRGGERIKAVVELLKEMAEKKELKTSDYVGMRDAMFDIQSELDRKMAELDNKMADNGDA